MQGREAHFIFWQKALPSGAVVAPQISDHFRLSAGLRVHRPFLSEATGRDAGHRESSHMVTVESTWLL